MTTTIRLRLAGVLAAAPLAHALTSAEGKASIIGNTPTELGTEAHGNAKAADVVAVVKSVLAE